MEILRKILLKIHHMFEIYYAYICFGSIFTAIVVGFLHFELKHNNKDLIYWKNLLEFCYHELEQFAFMVVMFIICIKIIFVGAIIMMNTRSVHWYDELTQLEVKKRYADFLLLRLIAEIDAIEMKYLRNNNTSDIMKTFVLAHEHMRITIENFRKDARKLLTPNEVEITLPIEDVYGVMENEMRYIKRSKFYNTDISANDDVIKKLVNP